MPVLDYHAVAIDSLRQSAAAVVAASAVVTSRPPPRRCVPHRDVPHVFKSDLHGAAVHDIVAQLTARGTGSGDGGSGDGSGAAVGSGRGVAVGVSVAASGIGGVGKTVLALQAFKHTDVVSAFARRRYWLTLGESPDVLSLVNDLLSDLAVDLSAVGVSLGYAVTSVSSMGEASEALDCLLRLMTIGGGRVLLVLDDVWRADQARPFLLHLHATLGEHWRRVCGVSYLLTSRQSALLSRQLGAVVRELGVVSDDASLELFWRCCGVDVGDATRRSHDAAARRICSRVCGGVALALQMVGGVVRSLVDTGSALLEAIPWLEDELPSSVSLVREDVDVHGCGGVVDPRAQYGSMRECVLLSLRSVGEGLRRRYLQLAVFGEDVVISNDVLAVLWGVSAAAAKIDCNMLLDRHLVLRAEDAAGAGAAGAGPSAGAVYVMLHDLQRDVLVREAGDVGLSAMHGSLLWSLANRCCGVSDTAACASGGLSGVDWCSLVGRGVSDVDASDVVVYARRHLSYHLGAMFDIMLSSRSRSVQLDGAVSSLSDACRALVHGVALNVDWLLGRYVCGGGSVAGVDGDVAVAERVVQHQLSCSGSSSSMAVAGDAAALNAALRVLGWVRRALGQQSHLIRRDVGRCASYLWASLEPVMRCCDDDGTRRLLGDVVHALDVRRRSACVDGGGGWLAVSSAGEMSAASALVRSLPGHTRAVTCVAVGCMDSSGRRCLVSGSEDGTLRVRDMETSEFIHELRGHCGVVMCVSDVFVGGDGRHMVASGSTDNAVRVWDVGGGMCLGVLEGHRDRVSGLSSMFVDSAGRRCVASASFDMSIRVWDMDAGACVGVMTGHEYFVNCVSVVGTVDGRQLLASGSEDCTVRLWNVASLACVRVMHWRRVRMAFVSGGIVDDSNRVLVASGTLDGRVRLWDVRTGECVRVLCRCNVTAIASVYSCIAVDSRRLMASGSSDCSMRLWDVATGECVGVVSVPGGKVTVVSNGFCVCIGGGADRVLVATASEDGVVRVWDVGSVLQSQSSRGSDRGVAVTCVSNSFVDRVSGRCVVASGYDDGSVALWDVDSGECVRMMTGHASYHDVTCISSSFTASGRQLLAFGSLDKTVRLWDVGSGECYRVLTGHDSWVRSVSSGFVDGTGRVFVASGSNDRTLRLWDVDSGKCVRVLRGHSDQVRCVSECFSDIGSGRRFIASGSNDDMVRVWDVDTGECVRVLSDHSNLVISISSGIVDGSGRQLLASVSEDSTIRLWDAVTGECVHVLEGHSGGVSCVTGGFVDGSDHHCIASTGRDGTLRVWDVSTGAAVSVVLLNEELGLSCPRDVDCVSIVRSGNKCRLALTAGGKLTFMEQLATPSITSAGC
jgi:WD40 repeat protein